MLPSYPVNNNITTGPYPIWSFLGLAYLSTLYTIAAHWYLRLTGLGKQLERQLPEIDFFASDATIRTDDSREKIALVTGSNTGVGYETAKCLVVVYGYTVILACRSRDKAMKAMAQINSEVQRSAVANHNGKAIFIAPLDLSSFDSVRLFCKEVKSYLSLGNQKLQLLINNAGLNSMGEVSIDKLDLTFQSNFLGHFLLTSLLFDTMIEKTTTTTTKQSITAATRPYCGGRIINLASVMHHVCGCRGNMNHIEFWKSVAQREGKSYFMNEATYALSKMAAILFTMELNRRYPGTVRSIAVNPGAVNSDIWRHFPRWIVNLIFPLFYLTTEQGCRTSVAAAVLDEKEIVIDKITHSCYLQPYWIPNIPIDNFDKTPFPVYEMLGPFQGYRIVRPRLPSLDAGPALWKACEEICGGCEWPDVSVDQVTS